jgi:6-pyruvoyltetrahydropterin/6-carboxytetrahydropterin synthase
MLVNDSTTIRKQFRFEAAHRLVSSYSQNCQNIHGHSYVVELYLSAPLNYDGMVTDFGEVKERFNGIIEAWDHSLIIDRQDPMFMELRPILDKWGMKYNMFPGNPTAEAMANYLYDFAMDIDLPVVKVRVHETTTGWAECTK